MALRQILKAGITGVVALFSLNFVDAAVAAPEPPRVRITLWSEGVYLNHGGGNGTTVGAPSTIPQVAPAETDAGDIWYLVDWNGGLLTSGDRVSLATRQVKQPYYLSSPSCQTGTRANTRKQATENAGIGATEEFTIIKVGRRGNSPGNTIRNRDAIAFRTAQGCHLVFPGRSSPIRVDSRTINPTTTWRLWYKVIPQERDDFPGHIQTCFGAAGASCWNNPMIDINDWTITGNTSKRTSYTSVGSIIHDNCCLRQPLGKNCGGVFSGREMTSSRKRPGRGTMALLDIGEIWQGESCEWEWQKAVQNQIFGDIWKTGFGAYRSQDPCPGCLTTGAKGWGYSADLLYRRRSNRNTWIRHRDQWRLWPTNMMSSYPGGFNETAITIGIAFPRGISLQYESDQDFCSSRSARFDFGVWRCN